MNEKQVIENDPKMEILASFFVAGVQFHELRTVSAEIKEGAILDLVLEPTNKYDPNAVRIEYEGTMLGYVPKKFSSTVAGNLTVGPVLCHVKTINMNKKTYEQLFVEILVEAYNES